MSTGKRFKGVNVLLILVVILIAGVFGALYRRGVPTYSNSVEDDVLNKISNAQSAGGELLLGGNDIEVLANAYIKDGIKKGNIRIDGVMTKVIKNDVSFTIPISYSNRRIMTTIRGSLSMDDEKYIFNVRGFKLGLLPIPKAFLLKKLSGVNVNGVKIEDSRIEVERNLAPLPLNSINVRDGFVVLDFIKVDKKLPTREEILKEAAEKIEKVASITDDSKNKNELKKVAGELKDGKADIEKVKKELDKIASKGNESDKKAVDDIIGTVVTAEDEGVDGRVQEMLKKTSKQVSGATSSLKTSEEKEVLKRIQSVVNIVIVNPKYNYKQDAAAVKAKYKGMNDTSKARVKKAILKYMDVKTLYELRNIFGV